MERRFRICLVTPGHLATNPRLVKEADALWAAGYDVSVVAGRYMPWADQADHEFESRPWRVAKVAYGPPSSPLRRVLLSIRRRAFGLVVRLFGPLPGLAERAFHWVVPELARAACQRPSDLYIAHNLAALPAAAKAARMHGALLGFDAEDFHSGEVADTPANAGTNRLVRAIERAYLPLCDHLTAASPGIARAYASTYGLRQPTVTLNVFPRADAPGGATAKGDAPEGSSLYWFSQTIGPERGLETAVEAISLSRARPTLCIRGVLAPGYGERLSSIAMKHGVANLLRFLPPAAPGEMVRLCAKHDIGLAAEVDVSLNREICITNKVFAYMLAGVPVVASATAGQREVARLAPGAIFLYPQRDASALANQIDVLLRSPEALAEARAIAWRAAQERFNWDVEQRALLEAVSATLASRR